MASKIGDLYWQVDANTSKFDKGLKDTDKSAKGMGKTFSTLAKGIVAGMGVAAVAGVAKLSKELITAASDAEETRNKFDVVYRDISQAAEDAAENLAENFGLSGTAARSLLADTGDLLTGFGFTQESALDLSDQVNQLAVDLASFTNFSGGAKGASDALTKALLGERESVKALGISILDADVKAKVLENTQNGITYETERQAKAMATLQIAQEQSQNAIGDFSRSLDSYANQTRIAEAATEDLKVALGASMIDAATGAQTALAGLTRSLADWVTQANEARSVRRDLLDGTQEEEASLEALQTEYGLLSAKIALANGRMTKAQKAEKIALEALITSYGIEDSFLQNKEEKAAALLRMTEDQRAADQKAADEKKENELALLSLGESAATRLQEIADSKLTSDERALKLLQDEINYWNELRGTVVGAEEVFQDLAKQKKDFLDQTNEKLKESVNIIQTQSEVDTMFRQAQADAQERHLADIEAEEQAIKALSDQYLYMGQIGLSVIGSVGEALGAGEDAWDAFAKAGVNAIAGVLDALAQQLLAQAAAIAASFFLGNISAPAGVGAALAGSASASLAAGVLRGYAGSFEQGGIIPQPPGVPATGDNMLARVNPGERIVPRDEAGQKLVIMLNLDGELLANTVINDYVNKGQILIDMTRGVR